MSAYRVEFTRSAEKEFERLSRGIQTKAAEALQLLSIKPYSDLLKVKKLKGADKLYRVRIGEYRIVYEVRKKELLVLVIKFGHRREVYMR